MLGTLYVGTTITSWILYGIGATAMSARMDREGYKMLKSKKTAAEKAVDWLKTILIMSIPGVNLLVAGITLFKFDELYDNLKTDFIMKKKIIKKEEYERQQAEKEKEPVNIDLQTKEMNNPKKYTELSNEEKLALLEDEKKRLLREKGETKTETVKPYNDKGAYSKKI